MERIAYSDGTTALTGWLARPAGAARAAVVIFPTIANVNEHMKRRAGMLADAGCLAMIADFYGESVPSFEAAGPLAQKLRATPEHYRARLAAAIAKLRGLAAGLPVVAIGYCMGGQAALEAARDGQDLVLAVSFHGLLDTQKPAEPGAIKARLLVCHGDADPMVPHEQVLAFWNEMNKAGADWHFHAYSGVKHGFTDPASDARGLRAIAYNPSAERQSWAALMAMLDEILG
ncbi:MAG: dienelactone hydrolase family protein [Novosphingobium sp.]